MRLEKVQEALKTKKIHYEYTEENGCGSIDFMFRGLRFHIWEYEDRVWGAETNVFEAGTVSYTHLCILCTGNHYCNCICNLSFYFQRTDSGSGSRRKR